MLLGSLMILVVASALPALPVLVVVMALAGFAVGTAQPSRDMLVRSATPTGASGKVFGFVYSGLDVGAALTSLLFGWLLDRGEPRALFGLVSVLMLLTIGTVVEVRRRSAPAVARS
jgi:MFS family permease